MEKNHWSFYQSHLNIYLVVFLCILGNTNQEFIPHGSQQIFDLVNRVSMTELRNDGNFQESYEVKSLITVNSVWNSGQTQLLEIFFSETAVSTPKTNGEPTLRNIEKIDEKPFYVFMEKGKPSQVAAHSSRDQSFLNMKRGIASLLQFQFESGMIREVDVSGQCSAHYTSKSSTKFEKIKTDCSGWDLRVNYRSEKPLDVWSQSNQKLFFELTSEGSLLNVKSFEMHKIGLNSKPDFGFHLESEMSLKHVAVVGGKVIQMPFKTLEEVISSLSNDYRIFNMDAEVDGAISEIRETTLKKQIAIHKAQLTDEHIGKEELAILIAELLPVARITKTREFIEILKSETGQKIRKQLVDLLGAVQTIDAHHAILALYKFDSNADYLETYLQALAIGTHPDRAIIEDLFAYLHENYENSMINEKLLDTLIQTIASCARQSTLSSNDELFTKISEYFTEYLVTKCSNVNFKIQFIRALQNLQDPKKIPLLMDLTKEKNKKISVAAMQALKTFPITFTFNDDHRKHFEAIFFQTYRKYDSSVRTLALDILLEMRPNKKQLGDVIDFLNSNDRNFEVKTYVLQKLQMITEKCPRFLALYRQTLSERPIMNNYNVLAQKGLTTAFHRELSETPSFDESLISVQEIHKGVLKRGSVELILRAGREEINTFKLGIYTNGLSSFVSESNTDNEDNENTGDDDEDESTTAGMEISVHNVHLRPLIFFDGQAELMGHIWSGTASESTPAYQATIPVEDHEKYILLQSGATVYIRFLGAKSIDLSGQVTMSIWNRNAHTEINQSTGTGIVGLMTVGTSFAVLEHKMILSSNPRINLVADSDFYTDTKLCVQLSRPEMNLTMRSTKSIKLHHQKKFKKEIKTKSHYTFPGKTLALNRKNNEMCNMIFSEQ